MKRPLLVTIIGILALLGGIAQAVFGAVFLGLRNDATLLADTKLSTSTITALGIACIVVGALTVVFAIGLLRGSRVARAFIGLSELAQLGLGIYAIVALDTARRGSAIGTVIGAVIVLYFLFGTKKAAAFFAKS
jgi:hypothetical protein